MLYALLCYNEEDVVWSRSKEQDDAVMASLAVIQERLVKAGKLGPNLRPHDEAAPCDGGDPLYTPAPAAVSRRAQPRVMRGSSHP